MKEAYLFTVVAAMVASWCAMAVPDFWTDVLTFIALFAFPVACVFTALRGRKSSSFFAGCGYGVANALGSVGVAHVLARFITNNLEVYVPPLIGFFIGMLIWGIAAVPICAIFRWIFAQRQKG